ncbi:hypothetical protein EYF80_025595 [Liparis tanakae]|uniref:Uncharacterized protein n=1 Tax=Liparis tanakae TaxID=230148 RepID=A0A4Z2HEC8_9TELE|nr:hypothetical protein EYF80_025595 [Liparis tanakae]
MTKGTGKHNRRYENNINQAFGWWPCPMFTLYIGRRRNDSLVSLSNSFIDVPNLSPSRASVTAQRRERNFWA